MTSLSASRVKTFAERILRAKPGWSVPRRLLVENRLDPPIVV